MWITLAVEVEGGQRTRPEEAGAIADEEEAKQSGAARDQGHASVERLHGLRQVNRRRRDPYAGGVHAQAGAPAQLRESGANPRFATGLEGGDLAIRGDGGDPRIGDRPVRRHPRGDAIERHPVLVENAQPVGDGLAREYARVGGQNLQVPGYAIRLRGEIGARREAEGRRERAQRGDGSRAGIRHHPATVSGCGFGGARP